jgi:hypothetical protein
MNTEVRSRTRAMAPGQDGAGTSQPAGSPRRARQGGIPPGRDPARAASRTAAPGRTAARGKTAVPSQSAAPSQLTVPSRITIPGTPEAHGRAAHAVTAARALRGPRMPFVLLVLSLLGGGLICLLVINTTLAAAQFQIGNLQQSIVRQSEQEQVLQQQVASKRSPAWLEGQALRLGLRPQTVLTFLDVRTGRIYTQPATVPGVSYAPAGYTP